MTTIIQDIPIGAVRPSPMNPRKTITDEGLQELAENIRVNGLIQPVTVRPAEIKINRDGSPCDYEIVCGERRYRAVKRLGWKTIPCIVREMTDEQALDAMITENLQRKDVDPMEEAAAFAMLCAKGQTAEELSKRFGKPERFIRERIRLDALCDSLKERVSDGTMAIGAAMHICKLSAEQQEDFSENYKKCDLITKSIAKRYTDRLFMLISAAPWNGTFKGSCGTSCNKCEFNDANAGCLFYEMRAHDGQCTSVERFKKKRIDWTMHVIGKEERLVELGSDIEAGMTVVAQRDCGYYKTATTELDAVIERCKADNIAVVKFDDYFIRYSKYDEEDERLQEKVKSGELCRVVVLDATWRGLDVSVEHCPFKKVSETERAREVEAMSLVADYRRVGEFAEEKKSERRRDLLRDSKNIPDGPLTQDEKMALLIVMFDKTPYLWRQEALPDSERVRRVDWLREHAAFMTDRIAREFLRSVLDAPGYYPDIREAQRLVARVWEKDKDDDSCAKIEMNADKRRSRIAERLAELGYNTDGTKVGGHE